MGCDTGTLIGTSAGGLRNLEFEVLFPPSGARKEPMGVCATLAPRGSCNVSPKPVTMETNVVPGDESRGRGTATRQKDLMAV